MRPLDFAEHLQKRAEELRAWGASQQANALEKAAQERRQTWRQYQEEALTPTEAAEECDYSPSHLSRLVGNKVPNAGDSENPCLKRKHLPAKPGASIEDTTPDEPRDESGESGKTTDTKTEIVDQITDRHLGGNADE